ELLRDTGAEWFEQNGSVYIVEIPAKTVSPGDKLPRIRLVSGFHTDVGQVREVDEDSLLALQLDGLCEMTNSPVLAFFAVADGIGGQDAGEIASRIAVHTLAAQVMQRIFIAELGGNQSPIEELSEQLYQAILAANQAILDLRETLDGSNMGCTLTAALLRGTTAVVANIGDSRTYLMHDGKLSQLTRDHSMVAKLVEQNLMRPEEIYSFEQKGVIYRSLGDNFDLLVDLDVVELSIGDRLLLCSDGLWDMVRDTFIEDVMLEQYDPQPASERLVELANMAGGEDNISVIVVDIRSPD
ncbi:MAG: serine/threonine-protein phosphatase, partial [Anaerolineales bacterium]|nr:serine/threonine-protein phosphatase [Anaerolineales bacterium]